MSPRWNKSELEWTRAVSGTSAPPSSSPLSTTAPSLTQRRRFRCFLDQHTLNGSYIHAVGVFDHNSSEDSDLPLHAWPCSPPLEGPHARSVGPFTSVVTSFRRAGASLCDGGPPKQSVPPVSSATDTPPRSFSDDSWFGNSVLPRDAHDVFTSSWMLCEAPAMQQCVQGAVAAESTPSACSIELRNVEGSQRFVCPSCENTYSAKAKLKQHVLRKHTDLPLMTLFPTKSTMVGKPFVCPFPACVRGFKSKGNLHRHLKQVHDDKTKRVRGRIPKQKRGSSTDDTDAN